MIAGTEIGLAEMLEEREWRFAEGQRLTQQMAQRALVCVTLNIAGPVKRFFLADETFEEAKRQTEEALADAGFALEKKAERVSACGYCAFYRVDAPADSVKRTLCGIEKSHPLGALMDLDVSDESGHRLGRPEIGEKERRCLICDQDAHACARSRSHAVQELQHATWDLMRHFFDARFSERVREAAEKALLYELSATPKPGLVDRINNGAHRDMDYFMFIRSAVVLGKYFEECALLGMKEPDEQMLFESLKPVGKRAEQEMLAATGGVNTHRGAIFSLGLISAAFGFLYANGSAPEAETILSVAGRIAQGSLAGLHLPAERTTARSHGQRMFDQYGVGGVRKEAAAGYPSIQTVGLPCLKRWLRKGADENGASVAVLIALMAHLEDTNVITRSNLEVANRVKQRAKDIQDRAQEPQALLELAKTLDTEMTIQNLSPGGCADMLAATWMLYFLCPDRIP